MTVTIVNNEYKAICIDGILGCEVLNDGTRVSFIFEHLTGFYIDLPIDVILPLGVSFFIDNSRESDKAECMLNPTKEKINKFIFSNKNKKGQKNENVNRS